MATDEEKQLRNMQDSKPTTLYTSPQASLKDDVEQLNHISNAKSKLPLSADEALSRARTYPEETLPIYLTFAPDDKENPRNWPKWRKWYITCFASMLNVVTYVSCSV